jgi:hypothetical protein
METAYSYKTFVFTSNTSRWHNPEDRILNSHAQSCASHIFNTYYRPTRLLFGRVSTHFPTISPINIFYTLLVSTSSSLYLSLLYFIIFTTQGVRHEVPRYVTSFLGPPACCETYMSYFTQTCRLCDHTQGRQFSCELISLYCYIRE